MFVLHQNTIMLLLGEQRKGDFAGHKNNLVKSDDQIRQPICGGEEEITVVVADQH